TRLGLPRSWPPGFSYRRLPRLSRSRLGPADIVPNLARLGFIVLGSGGDAGFWFALLGIADRPLVRHWHAWLGSFHWHFRIVLGFSGQVLSLFSVGVLCLTYHLGVIRCRFTRRCIWFL